MGPILISNKGIVKMAKKSVRASICWIPYEEGGRSSPPPAGTRYCPLVYFVDVEEPSNTWSADFVCTESNENNCSIVDFSYLVDDAPIQNLDSGKRFSLYEGLNLVANGEIL